MAEDKVSVVTINSDQLLGIKQMLESMERRIEAMERSVGIQTNNMKDLSKQMLTEYKSKLINLSITYESLISKKELSNYQSTSKVDVENIRAPSQHDVKQRIQSLVTEITIQNSIGLHMNELGNLR